MKVLCIDIGNSLLHLAIFENENILSTKNIPTKSPRLFDEIQREIKETNFKDIAIASCVPELNLKISELFMKNFSIFPKFITHENFHSIKNPYKKKNTIGIDRICNVYGLIKLYRKRGFVVDFGTAITIDAIDDNKEMFPIAIIPGIEISLISLLENTSGVKIKEIKETDNFYGASTKECVSIGILNSIKSGIKEIIQNFIKNKEWEEYKIIFTGGDAKIFLKYFKDVIYDPEITIKGIYEIYKQITN